MIGGSFYLSYNFLNLVSQVGSGTAEYTWLADGTKLSAVNAAGNGYDYVGSLIYSRLGAGTGTTRTLESAPFSGGRIIKTSSGYEVNYFITDHLGSTRVVFSQNLTDLQRSDYYPFGLQIGIQGGNNRYLYNGKETQVSLGSGYLDYGARMRGSDGWLTIDPLAEKYPWISPYAFAGNNPIRYVDWDGMAYGDFYDIDGNHIGRDGVDDDLRYVVTDRQEARSVKRADITAVSSLSSAVQLPSDAVLSESLNVLGRTVANGGRSEESSLVIKDGTVIRGQTGPELTPGAQLVTADLPNLPGGKSDSDVEASIHSHITSLDWDKSTGGVTAYSSALKVGPGDPAQFGRFGTNIIVGPLGAPIPGGRDMYGVKAPIPAGNGVAFYNRTYSDPYLSLPEKAVRRILGY